MTTATTWPSQRLKHVADVGFSTVDKKSAEGEIAVKLCNYTDVYYNDEITTDLPFMDATATIDEIRSFGLRTGDILITKDSEAADDIGVPAFVPTALDGVVCGYHLAVLRPKRSEVHPKFLFWVFASQYAREQMEVLASGVTRYGLRLGDVGNLRLHTPTLPKQRAIADFLDRETARIDAMLDMKKRLVRKVTDRLRALAQIRTGAMSALGFRGGSSQIQVGVVPLRRVISRIKTGGTPPTANPTFYEDGEIAWYGPRSFGEALELGEPSGHITQSAIAEGGAPMFPADSTVVVGIGATAGKVAHLDHEATANQQVTCLVAGPAVLPRFMSWQLWSAEELLRELAPRTTLPIVTNDFLKSFPFAVAGLDQQRDVVANLDHQAEIGKLIKHRVSVQIARLQEHRQGVITAVMTGQIDVPDSAA